MPRRGRTQRLRRVDETLRHVISDGLVGMSDARLRAVAVTGVEASPDTAYADVFVHIPGNEQRRAKTMAALEGARAVLQSRIASEMHLRNTPVLRFRIDEAIDHGQRIDQILAEHPPLPDPEPVETGPDP
jgi:ribosome-binding factor A